MRCLFSAVTPNFGPGLNSFGKCFVPHLTKAGVIAAASGIRNTRRLLWIPYAITASVHNDALCAFCGESEPGSGAVSSCASVGDR